MTGPGREARGDARGARPRRAEASDSTALDGPNNNRHVHLHFTPTRASWLNLEKPLAKFRRRGLTVAQIADRRGPSNVTVERAVGRFGITLPHRATAVNRIDAKRLAKLRRDGLRVVRYRRAARLLKADGRTCYPAPWDQAVSPVISAMTTSPPISGLEAERGRHHATLA
jgi:hypothetical protein